MLVETSSTAVTRCLDAVSLEKQIAACSVIVSTNAVKPLAPNLIPGHFEVHVRERFRFPLKMQC